ncbi:large subunit ribosomal protein L25 [Methylohalomonas lacus]|uniref:Large ribosomal subunit protein bL25 n=1 Tax=Methylohalomonas lacus TaxID=398773 RepID=A0AAE3HKG8_9GAMM|nr:50S ribosomal protein L25/general stress protein Ctc [Methylohalomonas lacus]MCS3902098.1 large subunit ribosomal protein L25 [Methylohalomonas lacus]
MSDEFELLAESRADVGKGASRRLRRAGRLPGIVYGHHSEATPITLDADTVKHQLDNEAFYSHILTLKLNGKSERVVLKDLQRHPYKPLALHIDLQRVSENEALHMNVPLHFLNEEDCKGVRLGDGIISHVYTDVEILCLPRDLPEYIEVDVADLDIGDSVLMSELKLPAGVELYAAHHGGDIEQPIVTVQAPRVVEEEETEGEEEAPEEPIATSQKGDAEDDDEAEADKD